MIDPDQYQYPDHDPQLDHWTSTDDDAGFEYVPEVPKQPNIEPRSTDFCERNEADSFVRRHGDDIAFVLFSLLISVGLGIERFSVGLIAAGCLGIWFLHIIGRGSTYAVQSTQPAEEPREPQPVVE